MISVEKIDTSSKREVHQFVRYPHQLYKGNAQWVPPLFIDAEMQLNRNKHPFYEHSDADFFLAKREGRIVGRIAALVNNRFNEYHQKHIGQFYLFDCEDDQEVAEVLFSTVYDWAHNRNLNRVIGPKGFCALDGYGLLVEGYEHRQMMNMMNYNHPYYVRLIEANGFSKEVDFISCYLHIDHFRMPERVHRIAERVQQRGTLRVQNFQSKNELREWAARIGEAYNKAFINNWEYYPLTKNEINFLLENILAVANPKLMKVIVHGEDAVGFLFGFPDASAAMQRAKGHLFPFGIIYLLRELKRTKWIAINGAGILPEFQGVGGNALLYSEIDKTIRESGFLEADLTQVAETAVQMRNDLINVGGIPYKNHRVYFKDI